MEPTENKKQVTNSIEGFLESAFSCIEENKFFQAREIFQQLLQQIPEQPNSLFGLGIISFRCNDRNEAKKIFLKILKQYPDSIGPLEYMALILFDEHCLDQATTYASKLVKIAPDNAIYHRNLAYLYQKQKKYPESIEHYALALKIKPIYTECLVNLGFIYKTQKKFDPAKKYYTHAITILPSSFESLIGLGDIENTEQGFEKAKTYYDKALNSSEEYQQLLKNRNYQPPVEKADYAKFLQQLGNTHKNNKKWSVAQICCESALQLNPDDPTTLMTLGEIYTGQYETELAKAYYERALAIKANYPECLRSLGNIYYEENDYEKAKAYYEKALAIDPEYAEVITNMGSLYHRQGEFDKEEACYHQVSELYKNKKETIPSVVYATCKFNLAILQLLKKNFQDGFLNYTARKEVIHEPFAPSPNIKFWDGKESLRDREILIIYEQGYGDYLQFIRLSENLKKQGAYVNAICSPQLKEIIQSVPSVDVANDYVDNDSRNHRYQVYIMELPRYLGINESNIPNKVPYIFADSNKVHKLRNLFKEKKSFKVGICYQGSLRHPNDKSRSINLKSFLPILKQKGAEYYSLAVDDPKKEAAALKNYITDLSPYINDFSDTVALIEHLDLVISVDTACVHLASAMNKPCWVLLPNVPDWRWQLNRDDSPWYPSLKLFRQTRLDDWSSVIKEVVSSLKSIINQDKQNGR